MQINGSAVLIDGSNRDIAPTILSAWAFTDDFRSNPYELRSSARDRLARFSAPLPSPTGSCCVRPSLAASSDALRVESTMSVKSTVARARSTRRCLSSNRGRKAPAFRAPYSFNQQSGIPAGRSEAVELEPAPPAPTAPVPIALFDVVEPTVLPVFPDDVPLAFVWFLSRTILLLTSQHRLEVAALEPEFVPVPLCICYPDNCHERSASDHSKTDFAHDDSFLSLTARTPRTLNAETKTAFH
jgi:hypothetical protein